MTSTQPSHQAGVDIAAERSILPYVALVAGVLSVPGSLFTWDSGLPGEGYAWGLPVAVLAVVLGIAAVRSGTHARWAAITGLVLVGAMTAMIVVWTLASAG
jgi:uncharacterized membrane protein (UPF0136 family)